MWELYVSEAGLKEVHAKSDAAAQLKVDISELLKNRYIQGYRIL